MQHLADKLDFVEGKQSVPGGESDQSLAGVGGSNSGTDIVQQINQILSRSGNRIDNLINSLGDEVCFFVVKKVFYVRGLRVLTEQGTRQGTI